MSETPKTSSELFATIRRYIRNSLPMQPFRGFPGADANDALLSLEEQYEKLIHSADEWRREALRLEEQLETERKARKAVESVNADEVLRKRTNLEAVIESQRAEITGLLEQLSSARTALEEILNETQKTRTHEATSLAIIEEIARRFVLSNPSSGALSTAGSMSAPEASSPASEPEGR